MLGFTDPEGILAKDAMEGVKKVGFFTFLIFSDPDGKLIEAQQQIW